MDEEMLTPAEVAAELRVDKETVLGWLRARKLAHIDLGFRTKRIRRSALDEYIRNRDTGACS